MTAAYVTRGRKYHANPDCPRMVGGEGLWLNNGAADGWPRQPGTYRSEEHSSDHAAMRGKMPCLYCIPAEARVFPPLYGQTFGHEPFECDGVPICARCFIQHRGWREAIAWPCASAVVLGLAPRNTP